MTIMKQKLRVLFYCRRNAVRSQMGEAFLKTFFPDKYDAHSARIAATDVHPTAKKVMAEIGIDNVRTSLKKCRGVCGDDV
jgi:protein-tyrosine-phosphatase